ncbi:unnamed protein product [Somion occarium]
MPERWSACSRALKQYDESMIKNWKEDIDTVLVFAGLFSAVLTAFIVELYRQLQYDPAEATALLLQQISTQVSLLGTDAIQNFTVQTYAGPDAVFTPDADYVTINTTWFAALVFSLLSALIGLVAKQWLRAYITTLSSSPRENVRLRQYRHDGLVKWRLAEIVGALPILLEIALVLFLYGLLELLAKLNSTISGVISAFVAMTFLFYLSTAVIPAFSSSSPFKSPQSWAISVCIWKVLRLFKRLKPKWSAGDILGASMDDDSIGPLPGSWRDREVESVRLRADRLDRRALARTYQSSLDEDFLDLVTPCINDLKSEDATTLIFEIIARRGECTVPTLLDSVRTSPSTLILNKFILRAGERGSDRLVRMFLDVLPRMMHDAERSKITVLDILHVLRKLITEAERAVCKNATHRKVLDTLALLIDERGTYHIQRASLRLLWEMSHFGCNMDYCPDGIGNVILTARDALSRNDHDTFVRASNVLLLRLPSLEGHDSWHGREWLDSWIRDLERYFRTRNLLGLRYDVHDINTQWCSGLVAISTKERELLREGLILALEEGAMRGLVDCDFEEGDALNHLRVTYLTVERFSFGFPVFRSHSMASHYVEDKGVTEVQMEEAKQEYGEED